MIRKHSPNSEYGDPYDLTRASRTNTEVYNAVTLPNIEKAARNQDEVIETHNEKMVEQQNKCDQAYETWLKKRDASEAKRNKALKKVRLPF